MTEVTEVTEVTGAEAARWWVPHDAPPCEVPGRAVRLDDPPRPRVRPLAEVLAEGRRAAAEGSAEGVTDAAVSPAALPVAPPVTAPGPEPAALAAARATAVRIVGAVAETASGRRPAHHLATICDDATRAALAPSLRALAGSATRAGPVRVVGVSAGAVEVSATLHGPTRARALAARLERDPHGPAWRLSVLVVL